ncbi:pectin lyase fold/virulence factor [Blyttiomyces helicus]|uniref:pectinesterase n=1 Tax=Blyttiomyces helicus TaxID=388810 RepID=A0A4P9WE46_9FUNG|nr:pectin lyase fold/virulence factor [Blyttiomyces helicus]|eukprot:RKO89518.1 pectin lyase fold/virulence factor [Blyttiomyces helicus]
MHFTTATVSALALFAVSASTGPISSNVLIVSKTAPAAPNVFRTVQAAIDAVPEHANTEQIIRVHAGIYFEQVTIAKSKPRVTLVGEGRNSSVIQFNRSSHTDGSSVSPTTVRVEADDFTAFGMTFMNTNTDAFLGEVGVRVAGPSPALYTQGVRNAVYNSWVLGWQDTLLVNRGNVLFINSFIEGAVDYIWGRGGAAFFHNCTLNTLRSGGYIIAEGTTAPVGGLNFTNLDSLLNSKNAPAGVANFYLGRPWGTAATAFFVDSFIPATINPTYWHTMTQGATPLYSDIGSKGPGANSISVNTALSVVVTKDQAAEFLSMDAWIPGASSWIQNPHRF